MPQYAAGWRMEPPVSLPRAMWQKPAATAAALPPLEPPGVRERSHGCAVRWKALSRTSCPCKLVHVQAGPDDGAGRAEAFDDVRVVGRDEVFEDAAWHSSSAGP
jgi:hypothetical protein